MAKPIKPFEPIRVDQVFKANSSYGPHEGWDCSVSGTSGNQDFGTPLKAVTDGEIVHFSESSKDYGNLVILKTNATGKELYIRYCHCSQVLVKSGTVKMGEVIAKMGSSGNSTAAHLHFDILKKKPSKWRYYTKATDEWFENPATFFETDIMQSDMSPIWVRQMFLELGLDIDKPEGEVRGRVQEVIDGFKKYGELQDKVTKLEKEVAFQIGEAAKHEQESVQFAKTIASLQDELSDLRHAVTQRDIDISKLQTTVQTLQDQIDPTKVIIVSLEDYQKLTSTNGLRAYTTINLFVELIKRIVVRRKI